MIYQRKLTPDNTINRFNNKKRKNNVKNKNPNCYFQINNNGENIIVYEFISTYKIKQNGENFILTNEIKGDNIELSCKKDEGFNPIIKSAEYSLKSLKQMIRSFDEIHSIQDAFNALNECIKNKEIKIEILSDRIHRVFFLKKSPELGESKLNLINQEHQNINEIYYNKILIALKETEINYLKNQLNSLKITLINKDKKIQELENKLKEYNIMSTDYQILELGKKLNTYENDIKRYNDCIIEMKENISLKEYELIEIKKENENIIKQKENKLKNLENEIKNLNYILEDNEKKNAFFIDKKDKEIKILKEEINNIKNNNNNNHNKIKNGNIIDAKFLSTDNRINNYIIKCYDEDIFATVEEELYKAFPSFRETNNIFIVNSLPVLRFKSMKDNKIKNSVPILVLVESKEYINTLNNIKKENNINDNNQMNNIGNNKNKNQNNMMINNLNIGNNFENNINRNLNEGNNNFVNFQNNMMNSLNNMINNDFIMNNLHINNNN